MLTVLFDTKGPLILDLNSCNDTRNVNCYCQTLQKLHIKTKKKHLRNVNDGIILLHNNAHPEVDYTLQDQLNAR
jgi:Transposase.